MPDRKHQGLPVPGYREQSEWAVTIVSEHKVMEEKILRRLDLLAEKTPGHVDPRWLAMARSSFENAFMQLNRAVFRPERIKLEDENHDAGL